MDKLLDQWENVYFTDLIALISIVATLLISIKNRKNYPALKFLPLYLLLFTILYCFEYYAYIFNIAVTFGIYQTDQILNYITTILEFSTFFYFFHFIMKKNLIKLLYLITLLFAIAIASYGIIFYKAIRTQELNVLYGIESVTLLSACTLYFVNLFKFLPIQQLKKLPDFWVATGLTFYLAGTFPPTFLSNYLFTTNMILYKNSYSIIYTLYTLLFIMIIIAYGHVKNYNAMLSKSHT